MKKLFSVILTLALAVSLIGCGGEGSTSTVSKISNDDDNAAATEKVTVENPYAGIEDYAGTTIRYATWSDPAESPSASVAANFTEKYGISIERVAVNQSDYITKISGLIAAGQAPDLIVDNLRFPAVFPIVQPLNDIPSINLDDPFWDAKYTQVGTLNGKTYLINSLNSPYSYRYMVFYNKKLFEDNNFKSPAEYYEEGNWTIDTFVECATRISRLGDNYIGAGVRLQTAAAIFGTEIVTFENGKFINNAKDETLKTAYKWVMDNKDAGIFITTQNSGAIKNNTMGMEVLGDFGLRSDGSYKGMDPDNLGFVPLPKVTRDGAQPSGSSYHSYGICKGAENPVATGYWLRYYLDYENHDKTALFDTEAASDFYEYLREIENEQYIMLSQGALDILGGEGSNQAYYKVITSSTSAQLDVNLSRLYNDIQGTIDKANKIIEDTVADQ